MLLQPSRVSSTSVCAITSERSTGLLLVLKFSSAIAAAEGLAGVDGASLFALSTMASIGGPKSSSAEGGGTSSGVIWNAVSGSGASSVVCVWLVCSAGFGGGVMEGSAVGFGGAGWGAAGVLAGVLAVAFAGATGVGLLIRVMPRRAIARSRA